MLNAEMILATLLWPAMATGLLLTLLLIPTIRTRPKVASSLVAVSVGVGFFVGYLNIIAPPEFFSPPLDAKSRLPTVALLGLGVALLRIWLPSRRATWLISGFFALFAYKLVFAAAIEFQWSTTEAIVRSLVFAAGLLVLFFSAEQLQSSQSPRISMAAIAGLGGLGAPLMLFSDSLVLAQLHGALGISAGVVFVVISIFPTQVPSSQIYTPVLAVAWCLWSIALVFANTPLLSFVLLASALPLAVLLPRLLPSHHRGLATVLTLSALIAGSLGIGGLRYKKTSDADTSAASEDDYGYGYE